MIKLLRKLPNCAIWICLVLFLAPIGIDAFAQTREYDLRLVQESVDCASRKVTFSAQIRASDPGGAFVLGSSSLLFTVQDTAGLKNPSLASVDNYSGGRYGTLTLTDQNPTVTLNVSYIGTAPYSDTANVTSAWTSIAHISFDVPAGSDGCYALTWNDENSFPATDVLKVVISGGTRTEEQALPGTFTNATGCAFAGLGPVATISGDTTIMSGQQATLKVDFTGTPPVSLVVDGVTYSNLSQSPLLVNVFPATTTTYTIDSISGACGNGTASGSATVTISDPGTLATLDLAEDTVCAGSTVQVAFTTTGSFDAGNSFTVQLSDVGGANFADIPTTGTASPLTATIPGGTAAGTGYRVRVVSSNPALTATPSAAFTISAAPTATLSGGGTIPDGGTASLNVQLTGTAPWQVTLSDSSQYTSSVSPLTISVSPSIGTTYTLLSVTDSCQAGTVSGSARIDVLPEGEPCKTLCVPVSIVIVR